MRLPNLLRHAAATLALTALLLPAAHADDYAVVVGINQYANLRGANLAGCVNDATAMAQSLSKYGFKVFMLKDGEATKGHILETLHAIAEKSTPNDRFAFYFAGHGSQLQDHSSVMLMTDSSEAGSDADMTPQELFNGIKGIPARSHSVILDSCFSGGMMRGVKSLKHKIRTRFYPRGGDKSLIKIPAQQVNDDTNHQVSGICYYTASKSVETAGEDDFNGVRHGVFTNFLMTRLNGEKQRWGDVDREVNKKVVSYMDDNQHPLLSPGYDDRAIFEGNEGPAPPPPPGPKPHPNTQWDVYNTNHVDPQRLSLTISTEVTPVPKGKGLKLNVTIGMDGFLVVVEKFKDRFQILFPSTDKVEAQGNTISLPGADANGKPQEFTPDEEGTEYIKAFLFKNKEDAEKLLACFDKDAQGARSISWENGNGARALIKRPATVADSAFFTADLTFEAIDAKDIQQ